ncbi:MAG: DUF4384 domain-containing protein, partial [Cyclobacteriaceae bacterium]|nr:DUF4384 domain-containing protein [Cyclobacteriaceae bacterium]
SNNCDNVVSLTAVLHSLQTTGAVQYAKLNTFCLDSISPALVADAAAHRISGYVRLFNTFDRKDIKINAIKAALHAGNPVILGLIAPPSFGRAGEFWLPKETPELGAAGHAVTVVAYDDKNSGGSIEVVNSWGKHWGKDGFTWIQYEDVERFVMYGYAIFDNQYSSCLNKVAAGSVRFTTTAGADMPASSSRLGFYRLDKAYPTKTEFTVRVNTEQKMYVYGVYTDASNAVQTFFPWGDNHYSNAIILNKHEFKLPPGDFPFTLEPPSGTNYLCFIFSATPLDIQAMAQQLQAGSGDFSARVKSAFKIRNGGQTVQWKEGMGFSVEYDAEFRIAMVVQLDQK